MVGSSEKRRTKETDSEAREVEICRSLTEDSTSKTASGKVSKQRVDLLERERVRKTLSENRPDRFPAVLSACP